MSIDHYHVVVWIDHHEARVFYVHRVSAEAIVLHPDHPPRNIHHKANSIGCGHSPADNKFFEATVDAIGDASALLVIGPSTAKTELVRFIYDRHPKLAKAVVGVEAQDHPSDGQILAMARRHFQVSDRMEA